MLLFAKPHYYLNGNNRTCIEESLLRLSSFRQHTQVVQVTLSKTTCLPCQAHDAQSQVIWPQANCQEHQVRQYMANLRSNLRSFVQRAQRNAAGKAGTGPAGAPGAPVAPDHNSTPGLPSCTHTHHRLTHSTSNGLTHTCCASCYHGQVMQSVLQVCNCGMHASMPS